MPGNLWQALVGLGQGASRNRQEASNSLPQAYEKALTICKWGHTALEKAVQGVGECAARKAILVREQQQGNCHAGMHGALAKSAEERCTHSPPVDWACACGEKVAFRGEG